jgi:hypothetical protein
MIGNQLKKTPIKIVGGTNFARYPKITNEQTVNMMVTTSNDISTLVDNSGYCLDIEFPEGQPRGQYVSTRLGQMMIVIGNNVYLINSNLGHRIIGTIETFDGPVYIAENLASEIALVDGTAFYVYNYAANTFTTMIIPTTTPSYISFLDTYFIITDANNNKWQISGNNNTTFDPLMVAYLQTAADNIQAVVPLNRTLWVMGKRVSELWNDNPTGSNAISMGAPVSFPFQRNNSLSIDYGVLSIETICSDFQMLVWLAYNAAAGPTVVYTTGGKPEDLSTDGLDYVLKNVINFPQRSTATLRQENGHIIYQLTFWDPSDNLSIQYDFSSKLWTNCTDENQNFHIMKKTVFFDGQQYFINFDEKKPGLYLLSPLITTYNGHVIPRIRICPPIRYNDQTFVCKNIELQMEQGENSNIRYIDMSISKDGGERFGNEYRYTMLPAGYRKGQVNIGWNLGLANDLRVKFLFLSAGRFVVQGATASILV